MNNLFNLDIAIIIIFIIWLLINSFIDIGKVKNINAFSVGRRSFSTFALGATITATFISGSGFVMDLNHFYNEGWSYLIPSICMVASFVLIATWLVPKMDRFLGKTSVATIMYEEYGQITRVITAISGATAVCGGIAVQFKILGSIGHYLVPNLSITSWVILLGGVTTMYTILGGIRSVVQTDIIQSICFCISILVSATVLYLDILNQPQDIQIDKTNFDVMSIFYLDAAKTETMILLGLYFLLPGLSPPTIQRISMGISTKQVQKSYYYSSAFILVIMLLSCGISYLSFLSNAGQETDVLKYFLDKLILPGSKAIAVIGVISMCMSTADSNINIASVLLANDTIYSKTWNNAKKLHIARSFGFFIGIAAIFCTFVEKDILSTVLLFRSFYMPIVTIPLLGVILRYKTSERCVLLAMGVSLIYVIIFKFIFNPDINAVPYGMLCNLCTLVVAHYTVEKWEWFKRFGITSKLKNKSK